MPRRTRPDEIMQATGPVLAAVAPGSNEHSIVFSPAEQEVRLEVLAELARLHLPLFDDEDDEPEDDGDTYMMCWGCARLPPRHIRGQKRGTRIRPDKLNGWVVRQHTQETPRPHKAAEIWCPKCARMEGLR